MEDVIKSIEPLDDDAEQALSCPCPFVRKFFKLDSRTDSDSDNGSRSKNFRISDLMDNNDVMMKFNVSARTLANWRKQGKIPFSRFGRKIIYHRDDIKRLLAEGFFENGKKRKP